MCPLYREEVETYHVGMEENIALTRGGPNPRSRSKEGNRLKVEEEETGKEQNEQERKGKRQKRKKCSISWRAEMTNKQKRWGFFEKKEKVGGKAEVKSRKASLQAPEENALC